MEKAEGFHDKPDNDPQSQWADVLRDTYGPGRDQTPRREQSTTAQLPQAELGNPVREVQHTQPEQTAPINSGSERRTHPSEQPAPDQGASPPEGGTPGRRPDQIPQPPEQDLRPEEGRTSTRCGDEQVSVAPRREKMEFDYKAVADQIAATGKIPDYLRRIFLEGTISPDGISLEKLNEYLRQKGMEITLGSIKDGLTASIDGMQITLTKNGRTLQVDSSFSPEAGAKSRELSGELSRKKHSDQGTVNYEEIAEVIASKGTIPESIRQGLQAGLANGPEIYLSKLNAMLAKHGLRLELKPLKTGLQLNLYQNNELVDSEVARTRQALQTADEMLKWQRKLEALNRMPSPFNPYTEVSQFPPR